ncbi:MAG: TIGR01777 family oxidoreductase [Pirellulaceae bacterium]|nr:TIGR01777 family oxidoreductase [Pirellulaceae bacterium]
MNYAREVKLPVSSSEAFAWHERPGALERLIPPWESVRVLDREPGIGPGTRVKLRQRLGPLPITWLAEHREYVPPRQFRDIQLSGPFATWDHVHAFRDAGDGSVLRDDVTFQLPGGEVGRWIAGGYTQTQIDRMFRYRHETTLQDLTAHARFRGKKAMRIAITGSTGLVGSALVPFLTTGGHQVQRIVRGKPSDGECQWDPNAGTIDAASLEGVDAVVHLAGENIAGGRWTAARKQRIRDSRVLGTRLLAETLARLRQPPRVLVSASAIGFYGDRGDEQLDESSAAGSGFLVEVAQQWEQATQPAADAGIRVVNARFGVILSPLGGALKTMLPPFRLGLGGVIGSGQQYMSWIGLDDAVGALHFALMTDQLRGPVNVVAPEPLTNREFTRTLGKVLHRPTIFPVPAPLARLGLGEMADHLLLCSVRVYPRRLQEQAYAFRNPDLEGALRHLLGRPE